MSADPKDAAKRPPTALSPFAASAITGGKPIPTMWLTWRYTLSAFLVPFIFVLSGLGSLPLLVMEPLYMGIGVVMIAAGVIIHVIGNRARTDRDDDTRADAPTSQRPQTVPDAS